MIDCPSESYIPNLLSHPHIVEHAKSCLLMIHSLGKGVIENADYVNWIKSLRNVQKHIILSPEYGQSNVNFTSSLQQHLLFRQKDPLTFPLPHSSLEFKNRDLFKDVDSVVAGEGGMTIDIYPTLQTTPPEERLFTNANNGEEWKEDFYVIPLGTGSCAPSKYRNGAFWSSFRIINTIQYLQRF